MRVININKYINLFSTVRLCANYVDAVVTVQQIGPHACGFNGFKTQKDVRFVATHNDRLELLYGKHAYEIEFKPPPSVETFTLRKRSYESETEKTEPKPKMLKFSCSDNHSEESDNEEKRLSSNGVHSNQNKLDTSSSTSSKQNNETSSTDGEWDSIDNGKLLIYTAPSVPNRAKVILIIKFN